MENVLTNSLKIIKPIILVTNSNFVITPVEGFKVSLKKCLHFLL